MTDYAGLDFLTDQSLVADPTRTTTTCGSRTRCFGWSHTASSRSPAATRHSASTRTSRTSPRSSLSAGRSLPCRSPPRATTSTLRSTRTAPHSRCTSTWSPWIPEHTKARSLLSRLLTPKRLKENEDFMWRLADRQLDEFLAEGHSEFLAEYAKPFSLLVIADLLGVPEEDHREFRVVLGAERPGARVGSLDHESVGRNPLEFLDEKFSGYLRTAAAGPRRRADRPGDRQVPRRVHPGDHRRGAHRDIFVRGRPGDHRQAAVGRDQGPRRAPGHSAGLRGDRSLIPTFIEESLRLESPVKSDSRLAPPDDEGRRIGRQGRHRRDGATRCGQSRSAPVQRSARVRPPPRQRPRAHRFRPRRALLPGRATGARGGPGVAGAHAGSDGRDHRRRDVPRATGARSYNYEPTYILRGSPTFTSGSPGGLSVRRPRGPDRLTVLRGAGEEQAVGRLRDVGLVAAAVAVELPTPTIGGDRK